MRVVIDTNVFVSAVWRDRNPEIVILWVCEQPDWQWVVSEEIKKEYEEILRRKKFSLTPQVLQAWDDVIDGFTVEVEVDQEIQFPRDQKDAKFIACALSCGADYMITGDKDFTEAKKLLQTTILSVSMFKNLFCDETLVSAKS